MDKFFTKRLKGMMGRSHVLVSLCVLLIFTLIPSKFFITTFGSLRNNPILFFVCACILAGGALLPDSDNDKSTFGSIIGPIGSIFTIFMKSTSSIVWSIYHTKRDRKPESQHRFLWHAPLIWLGLGWLFYTQLPTGNYTIFTNLSNSVATGNLDYFIQTNSLLLLFIILCFFSALVGSTIIADKFLRRWFNLPSYIKYILPAVVILYIFTTTYSNLRIMGLCLATGCFLHCIEDGFCDSGLPSLIFPIPQFWRNMIWGRIKLFPITITTGGAANNILDVIAGFLLVFLLFIVAKGGF